MARPDDEFMIEIVGDGIPQPVLKPVWNDLGECLSLAGYRHICFDVHDVHNVDAAVAELRRRGVHIVTEPFELPVGDRKLAFFADPFSNLFELAEVLP